MSIDFFLAKWRKNKWGLSEDRWNMTYQKRVWDHSPNYPRGGQFHPSLPCFVWYRGECHFVNFPPEASLRKVSKCSFLHCNWYQPRNFNWLTCAILHSNALMSACSIQNQSVRSNLIKSDKKESRRRSTAQCRFSYLIDPKCNWIGSYPNCRTKGRTGWYTTHKIECMQIL